MCCFFTTLFVAGPRLAFLVLLLFPYGQAKASLAFNTVLWPLLGWLFLPWTTLMYVIVYPIVGFNWIWIGLGILADIATYSAAAYRRQDIPYYTGP